MAIPAERIHPRPGRRDLGFLKELFKAREAHLRQIEQINGHLSAHGLHNAVAHAAEQGLTHGMPFMEGLNGPAPLRHLGAADANFPESYPGISAAPHQSLQAPPPMFGIGSVGEDYSAPVDVARGFRAPETYVGPGGVPLPPRRRPGYHPASVAGARALAY